MKAVEFIQASVQGLHQTLIEDMKELTQEQLAWRPQPGANPIGAIFLHYIRTEDAFVQRMRGLPPLWDAEKWDEKSGIALPSFRLSPGEEEADMAASLPLAESLVYARQVMDSTRTFMETLDDDKLDVVPDPDNPGGPSRSISGLSSWATAGGTWGRSNTSRASRVCPRLSDQ